MSFGKNPFSTPARRSLLKKPALPVARDSCGMTGCSYSPNKLLQGYGLDERIAERDSLFISADEMAKPVPESASRGENFFLHFHIRQRNLSAAVCRIAGRRRNQSLPAALHRQSRTPQLEQAHRCGRSHGFNSHLDAAQTHLALFAKGRYHQRRRRVLSARRHQL